MTVVVAGRRSLGVVCSVVLTACATAGSLDGHIQSQAPYHEEGGMSLRILRSSDVVDAPMSGHVVGVLRRGDTVTAFCFRRVRDPSVIRVTGVAEDCVTLDHTMQTFDASVTEIRSVLAACER